MNRLVIGLIATIALITSAVVPAQADTSENVIIGVMGGVIGGMIIGEALEHNHKHKHRHRRNDVYVERCRTEWNRYYDPYYDEWVAHPVRQCWIERVR